MSKSRQCLECGDSKPTSDFDKTHSGFSKNCKDCQQKLQKRKEATGKSREKFAEFEEKLSSCYWLLRELKTLADRENKDGLVSADVFVKINRWFDAITELRDNIR